MQSFFVYIHTVGDDDNSSMWILATILMLLLLAVLMYFMCHWMSEYCLDYQRYYNTSNPVKLAILVWQDRKGFLRTDDGGGGGDVDKSITPPPSE